MNLYGAGINVGCRLGATMEVGATLSGNRRVIFRGSVRFSGWLAPTGHEYERQLYSSRNSQLFKHDEQIVLDGVLAQPKAFGDIPICEPFRDQHTNIALAFCKDVACGSRGDRCIGMCPQFFKQIVNLLGIRPQLSCKHRTDALCEISRYLFAGEHTSGAEAKSLDNDASVV